MIRPDSWVFRKVVVADPVGETLVFRGNIEIGGESYQKKVRTKFTLDL